MWGRWVMALGGLLAVLLTPAFALSYFAAYGTGREPPPDVLAVLRAPLVDIGLVGVDPTAAYDAYGLLYLAAWVIGLVGLIGVLSGQWAIFPRPVRRAWTVALACLALVAVGMLGDYGLPDDLGGGSGFALTVLGFLASTVAFAVLGRRLRRDLGVRRSAAWSIGLLGVVSVLAGMGLVGHIPSGPGLGFAVAALVAGLTRPWGRTRRTEPV
jgi:hypothetical protein